MKRTKEEALLTKEAIIDSALEVFLEKGFAASTLQDVAENAKMTRGAVYWHFKGKEDLFYSLYEREHNYIIKVFIEALTSKFPPVEKLNYVMKQILTTFYKSSRFSNYIKLSFFKTEQSSLINVNRNKLGTMTFVLEEFEKIAQKGIKDQSIAQNYNAKNIAKTLLALISGIYRLRWVTPDAFGDLEPSLALAKTYINSIKKNKND